MEFEYFFQSLGRPVRGTFRDFQHVNRLVLDYGTCQGCDTKTYFDGIWGTFTSARCHFLLKAKPQPIESAWISRSAAGIGADWKLTLDFKSGLVPVEDALWTNKGTEGLLQTKRFFSHLDDIKHDDHFEDGYAIETHHSTSAASEHEYESRDGDDEEIEQEMICRKEKLIRKRCAVELIFLPTPTFQ
ncbi:hypothetical protein CC86DRAFT_416577 [Ophiobolus disseminans]|uniref:Uncharacterized protein n=1 Tax=Ophiobolus disseminans TaxID=1469910 RepID=A0A6A7A158_9PLEO|nr:hypothetical protein CC86DRAFT_416577 [Ophiobolus disseminans]